MRCLHHMPLSPFCRKVRLVMREKGLDFQLVPHNPWSDTNDLIKLNHACQVPVLVEDDQESTTIADSTAIVEYLEEIYPEVEMMPSNPIDRAEVRRLCQWFDNKFFYEVTFPILREKFYKRFIVKEIPDSISIRYSAHNIKLHIKYISWLLYRRNWLAGSNLSLADISAASQLSVVDYFSSVPWNETAIAKQWYSRIKSRPTFRELLNEYISGIPMPEHYPNLDF